ncbi:MAG: apolipoprotein N-acyltransferase [Actinomycetota bacterium]|nr:apolipoprotein N-acyltransferase [Actinomycetota bacterium]
MAAAETVTVGARALPATATKTASQGQPTGAPGDSTPLLRGALGQLLLLLGRLAGAVVSGLLLVGAFPPVGDWWLAPAGVATLALAVRGTRLWLGAVLGLVAGLALFGPLLSWLQPVGSDAWLALALLEALAIGLLGAALAVVSRLPGWPLWGAALWVAEEAARDRLPLGGFPWGRLAFSQASSPLTPYAAAGGAPLVTGAVALAGGLLAGAVLYAGQRRPLALGATLSAVLLLGAGGYALAPSTGGGGSTVRVALVQGNVPRTGLDAFGQRSAVLHNHVDATLELAARIERGDAARPDLVIWPENSTDIDPLADPEAANLITSAAGAVGRPILVGAVLAGPGRYIRNVGLLWDPVSGPGDSYVKRHPVPFGEYVPARPLLQRLVGRFDRIPHDFLAGDRPGVLGVAGTALGDVICFEVAYDGVVRDAVTAGGRVLVVQTNNATFGRSGESAQQLAMSRLRAVEHDRSVLVAATSGISAVVTPDGRLRARSGQFTREILTADVPVRADRTLADRLGTGPEWALTGLGLGALVVAALRGRRRRAAESSP